MRIRPLRLIASALLASALLLGGPTPRPAKSLELQPVNAQKVALEDLRGKAVMVMFFSTDCPHCQEAARTLAPLYEKYKPQGFEVLALAMNPSAEQNLKQFIETYDVEYPTGYATRSEFSRFSELSVMERFYYPYLIFVDPSGTVRAEHQGGDRQFFGNLAESLEATIQGLLKHKSRS